MPTDVMVRISEQAGIPLSRLMGVATFYSQFKLNAPGKYKVLVCMGTACHVNNGERVADAVAKTLGVKEGETTPTVFSLKRSPALAAAAFHQ